MDVSLHGLAFHLIFFLLGWFDTEFESLDQLRLTYGDKCWWKLWIISGGNTGQSSGQSPSLGLWVWDPKLPNSNKIYIMKINEKWKRQIKNKRREQNNNNINNAFFIVVICFMN